MRGDTRLSLAEGAELCGIPAMLLEHAFIDAITLTFDRWYAKWVQSGTRETAWQVYEHGAWAVYFARHTN